MNATMMVYQTKARETAGPADDAIRDMFLVQDKRLDDQQMAILLRVLYPVMGLANEAGEVLGKAKKLLRDRGGVIDDEFRRMMAAELGDVLWYLSDCCTQLGLNLSTVAEMNIMKLKERQQKGTLQGDGDDR